MRFWLGGLVGWLALLTCCGLRYPRALLFCKEDFIMMMMIIIIITITFVHILQYLLGLSFYIPYAYLVGKVRLGTLPTKGLLPLPQAKNNTIPDW